jgi:hypothetical protein
VARDRYWNESRRLALWALRGEEYVESRADKFRQHAIECLEAAQAVTDLRIRGNLIAVAESWRRLADQAERKSKISLIQTNQRNLGDDQDGVS